MQKWIFVLPLIVLVLRAPSLGGSVGPGGEPTGNGTGFSEDMMPAPEPTEPVTAAQDFPTPPVEPTEPNEAKKDATPLKRTWQPPNYSGQESSLGWTPEAFAVPKGMESRVQFWRDIYTKYTSDQGVLHDSVYVHLVYDNVDFTAINADSNLTSHQKEKARRKLVEDQKKAVNERLHRLQALSNGDALEGEDKRYWQMFASIDEPNKFIEAGKKGRLRFQLGQRNQFISGIAQSGRYLKQMEDIFRDQGVPLELTRLPFVESSFNLRARSKVGASGLWQFMRSTARLYMRLDNSADERNDPLRATLAAAKKMRDNYQMLKTWPLAVTAYNHGPSGVKRLTEKMGTTDIVELIEVRKGRFGFASANFFASFLAALDVERNADKHFGVIELQPEIRGAEVQLVKNMTAKDLLKWFDNNTELAQQLNPHIAEAVWKGKAQLTRKHILRVPIHQEESARNGM